MTAKTTTEAREIDTHLAALWTELYQTRERIARYASSLFSYAGAEYYYRGRQRVTDMPLADAVAYCATLIEAHADASDYARFDLNPPIRSASSMGDVRRSVAGYNDHVAKADALAESIEALEAEYTGWNRYFLVTSSAGHIHRSMYCSTCRPTTTYGWLPELSGKTDDVAVAELGPTLCTVCFPDAPVAWTAGKKLTAAQAAKKAA